MLQERARVEDEEVEGGAVPGGEAAHPEDSSEAGADLLVSYVCHFGKGLFFLFVGVF